MNRHRQNYSKAWPVTGLVLLAWLTGCGGGGASDGAGAGASFATAESLLEQFNAMCSREPVDVAGVVAMFHPESDLQQRLVAQLQASLPLYELEAAMRAEFNSPFDPASPQPFGALIILPAHVTKTEGERVQAEYLDFDDTPRTLHLVMAGGRWWISGYTLEYDSRFNKQDEPAPAAGMSESDRRQLIAVAPAMIKRIRAGEFRGPMQARNVVRQAAGLPNTKP